MDPRKNPFSPGAGSRPPELAGREQLITDAETALFRVKNGRSTQALFMLGLRGTGKTVLLNEFETLALENGYLTSLVEAPDRKPLCELLYPQIRQVLRKLSHIENVRQAANDGLRALRSFASTFNIKIGDVEIGVDPLPGTADSGDLEFDLRDLFLLVGEASRQAGKGWALLIDEVQYLKKDDLAALITALHKVNQRSLPIFFAGAGLPQLAKLAGDAKSYAERLFDYREIGALGASAAADALRTPLAAEKMQVTDDALARVVLDTKSYPFFLQEWGYQIWNIAQASPIGLAEIEAAGPKAISRLDGGFFRVRLDRLTDAEVKYVQAMAALGRGPYKSNEVAKRLGKEPSGLAPRRASIISKGMIYSPNHGDIDFTVPMFDEFLQRKGNSTQ